MSRFIASCVLLGLGVLIMPQTSAQEPVAPRVVLISIDGMMPSSYTGEAYAADTPHLRALARDGVFADGVVGVLPTVTYPSHTTLITGVEPAKHGIYDNTILDPENRSNGAWYWYANAIKVPTLPMAARARGLRAAAVTWPVTIGMDLDVNAPEYIGSRHAESLEMLRVLSQPAGLLDGAANARGKAFSWPQTDRDRTDLATYILKTYDPHVLLVHLIALDTAQHGFGPGSPEAHRTLRALDANVGEIVAVARAAGRAPTTVAVVSDHGFLAVQQQVQPNAAFREAGLLSVDSRGAVTDWKAWFHSSGGSGYVFVKNAADRAQVATMLAAMKQNPANGIREIWTHEELVARGAHPDAEFGLDVVDGFYTGAGHDVLVKATTSKGGHGFGPDRTALHASLVLNGPQVQRRGSLGVVKMTQIAPTLANILGVRLSAEAAPALEIAATATTAR